MPQPFDNAVMTNEGASLLNKAQLGKAFIEFTRVATGSGTYSEDERTVEALQERTGLKDQRNAYPISSAEINTKYSVKISALISNQDPVTGETLITDGYYINEIGLFAKPKDGDDSEEVLYSIAVTSGDHGDFMPAYNGSSPAQITQEYYATVNNSSEITIKTAGAALLAEDANIIRDDTTNEKYKLGVDNGLLYVEKIGNDTD
jgi:hypothetical protein